LNRGAVIQQISTEKEHKSGVASFSHDDKLIAVNSSIYDANTSKKINTFMDFGNEETACFHPNNTEYIKGQYVWDLRTFKLLHTVKDFKESNLAFNFTGSAIYSAQSPLIENSINSLKVVDGLNYNLTNSFQTKYCITDLCCDMQDNHIAIIEGHLESIRDATTQPEPSYCRILQVGCNKDDDEEDGENNEDDDEEDDEDDFYSIGSSISESNNDSFGSFDESSSEESEYSISSDSDFSREDGDES